MNHHYEHNIGWFNSDSKIDCLENEATSWLGTPFLAHGRAKGEGVCCHQLCYLIYRSCGALPEYVLPKSGTRLGDQLKLARMSKWLGQQKEFFAIDPVRANIGDLLIFRPGGGENHMGIRLRDQRFIHVTRHRGVSVNSLLDPTYHMTLSAAWRIQQ